MGWNFSYFKEINVAICSDRDDDDMIMYAFTIIYLVNDNAQTRMY